ncbi:hypothetical protein PIIN_10257 [Serendipita indica DSM 11827]|uniref:Uncharacterized protein n=1 Tax=Serendipita indica (strain DSM 11827) TaxID=1109443 RepID=G4TY69_SERID|nr:hypothetical protein PIIN_10257 [Serendipita indica DSM 11827]
MPADEFRGGWLVRNNTWVSGATKVRFGSYLRHGAEGVEHVGAKEPDRDARIPRRLCIRQDMDTRLLKDRLTTQPFSLEDVKWEWGAEEEAAMDWLNPLVSSPLCLHPIDYRSRCEFIMMIYSSVIAAGYVLAQLDESGKKLLALSTYRNSQKAGNSRPRKDL